MKIKNIALLFAMSVSGLQAMQIGVTKTSPKAHEMTEYSCITNRKMSEDRSINILDQEGPFSQLTPTSSDFCDCSKITESIINLAMNRVLKGIGTQQSSTAIKQHKE